MLPPKLDHLFTVRFRDGSVYRQTPQDRSIDEPLTRSAFYDVERRMADVVSFALSDGTREHTVDMDRLEIVTDGRAIPNPYGPIRFRRLVYFRRMEQSLTTERVTGRIVGVQREARLKAYFTGWRGYDATGELRQVAIEIAPTLAGSPALVHA